jgi:hypothetical protein
MTTWVHGVVAIVGNKVDDATERKQSDEGTIIKQPANTENWFHFPITLQTLPGDPQQAGSIAVLLDVFVGESVVIDKIHLRQNQLPLIERNDLSINGGERKETIEQRCVIARGALCVSVHAKFLPNVPVGTLIFRAVGIKFGSFSNCL